MEFESVEQTAKRLQVTTRTVQKWAKDGKIPGACQMGRAWLIPASFAGPSKVDPVPVPVQEEPSPIVWTNPTLYDAVYEPAIYGSI